MNQAPTNPSGADGDAFLVGDLRVDVGQQRVTRADVDIALPNLSFQLLVALIRVAPNVLGHDALMTRVWPGLVVSPETVNKRVNLLREALGDDPKDPRYIAGVRSRGYRLVATVSATSRVTPTAGVPLARPAIEPPPVEHSTQEPLAHRLRSAADRAGRLRWLFVAILFVVVIAIGVALRPAVRDRSAPAMRSADDAQRTAMTIGAPERTVAVLPFDDTSADPTDAYLAQGLPEMILDRISRISGLAVIARSSSFSLPTKAMDSREIGRRLNSTFLVDGSVQRQANRLRVAVHLVDSASATMIWSAQFDRDVHDLFSIEDEVAEKVASALSARLGGLQPNLVALRRSENIEAYLAFLRGRSLLGRFSATDSDAAVPHFEKSLAIDPEFAAAYASLYDAHIQAASLRGQDLASVRLRYRPLIERALEIDPNSGPAYFARAMWGGATNERRDADFRRGLALDPSNGRGLTAYSEFLDEDMGRPEDARTMLKRALWVDPLSPRGRFLEAWNSLDDDGVQVTEQKLLKFLELDPNFVPALHRYGTYRWLIDGRLAEAIQITEHAIALDPENHALRDAALAIYLDLSDERAARAVVTGRTQSARAMGLLAMHEGDWRRAGLSAYDEAGWKHDGAYCELWQGEALRDYALKTGELSRAIEFIGSKFELVDLQAPRMDECNDGAAIYLSELLAVAGHTDRALTLRGAAASWNDANEARYHGGMRRLRARVLLLEGERDAALTELAESFRSGFYVQWWYTMNHDPLWLPLHGDRRFQAIAADVRRYVDAQRSDLDALRREDLPRRTDPATLR
jgi:TolB-like protein/DNA-binding winged helix-turn-helix (wHTH) protein